MNPLLDAHRLPPFSQIQPDHVVPAIDTILSENRQRIADIVAHVQQHDVTVENFLLPFEVAAVILTVAVIAAVMLTLRRRAGAKHQNPSEQARVRAGDRIRMIKMEAVKPVVPAPAEPAAQEAKP